MKKAAAYAILILGLLGVIAATHTNHNANAKAMHTADWIPWPPH